MRSFRGTLERAVDDGLVGVALVDKDGVTVASAGDIEAEEAMPLAALVMYRLDGPDLKRRLFRGEVLHVRVHDRDVSVGIAKRQLFVVAIRASASPAQYDLVAELRHDVEQSLPADREPAVLPAWLEDKAGGGGGAPAALELALGELGVTPPRIRGKA